MVLDQRGIAERYVELSHGRTRYLEAGSGPPVILLHGVGFTSGGDTWLFNVGPLSERLRVLAPDFLGWGLGDRLDAEYSFGYLADFVREFQDALGLARSHVVGHSMGGWVASVFAYESPNRVDKLVLVASGGTSTRTLRSMTEFSPPTRDDVRQGLAARVWAPGADLEALADADYAKTRVPGALEAYRKILRHMNDPANRQRYNTLRRLPHVQAPTLVVWGSADQTNALEMGEETARLIPGARLAVVENCGHFIPTERPDELNRLLLEFL